MSGTVNKVILIGHTGDDVKMHYFDDNNCIGRFPLATNEDYLSKTGERVSNTEWHNVVVRNKAAEICEKYLKKGDKVYIEGRIKGRKWVDNNGVERYSTEINCNEFTFLTPKSTSTERVQETPSNTNPVSSSSPTSQPTSATTEKTEEDDLPF